MRCIALIIALIGAGPSLAAEPREIIRDGKNNGSPISAASPDLRAAWKVQWDCIDEHADRFAETSEPAEVAARSAEIACRKYERGIQQMEIDDMARDGTNRSMVTKLVLGGVEERRQIIRDRALLRIMEIRTKPKL